MKTDLKKVLAISGYSGLYKYVSQVKSGIIAESMQDGKRSMFGIQSRVTALSDVSIYRESGEIKLKEVFEKMKTSLKEENAPNAKSEPKVLSEFFISIIPDYDKDKFYSSHMKKVVEWYNVLKTNDALEFEEENSSEN